ncbi:enoyl-CoA hydratase/isomerase family protein [Ginsengibacter hankyongi]|uniref:Enoyl-CoA hydratase/isomerase family protein n=1 Tax=Ginsengibacter hankyongi TaxID=2607284 RepID=A0A5J5IDW4_9BACT|nr:enoyl-CoA hydratase/isomerase family protein [Ginsengibacter hankyongi]KAA9036136.1 enoyl-CoA hydratase/isomerase family protein [Ginsengibacter hankyongi]
MKQYETIELELQDGVATLILNRPEFLNAMNFQMMNEIIEALTVITSDPSIRVAVITGKGRSFMTGADIKEYAVQTPEQFKSFQQKGIKLYQTIENAAIPFIAAINGFALGGGFEIALACDFIIAIDSAKMGLPEVHLGLIPGGGGTQRLLYKIGMNRVKEMLMLGQSYSAQQMLEWGIVNIICADGDLAATVKETADKFKRRPGQSLRSIKKLLHPDVIEAPFSERIIKEGDEVFHLFYTSVAQDLIKKFAKKNG